jgi:hypothetical protein
MSFEVRKAQRQGARLLIQLSGVSGSGKTYTALQLAYGLAGNDANKIVLIDTENRRGSLYANALPQPFNIIDFYSPFSPDRYIAAIEAACNAGAEVIVIDSVTHEWESEGGCEWIANQSRFPDWKTAKKLHKRFMTYMLQCPAHIIACTRAREKVDFSNPKEPIKLGIQPIQEKNFSYEATVSLMMQNQGYSQDVLKCPAELQGILGRGQGYITSEDGMSLRNWVDGAEKVDPKIEHYRGLVLNSTEGGMESLKAQWSQTPADIQKVLGKAFLDSAKASAKAFDDQRAFGTANEDESIASLNSLASQQANNQFAAKPKPDQQPQSQPEKADDDEPMF